MSRQPSKEGFGVGRKFKRFARKTRMDDALQIAYYLGEDAARNKKTARNPYPPGKRYAEWQRGFEMDDATQCERLAYGRGE